MKLIDGYPTDSRIPGPGIRELFELNARRQRYLDVESALAAAQASCRLIPQEAATRIGSCARLELLDQGRLAAAEALTGHSIVPLVSELARVVGDEHGGWVHWGATSQNISQTGDLIGIRAAHDRILELVASCLDALADLGGRTADLVMAGRTHGQQAVPITFGLKVAAWSDVMVRNLDRLSALRPRLFVAMTGGAAGTFAAMGPRGPQIQQDVGQRLGLGTMPVPSRSIADAFAELVCCYAILGSSCAMIAGEVAHLTASEFAEVTEAAPPGDVGSSTMPQKQNPKLCMDVLALSAQLRALAPLALEAMIHEHEGDGARWAMMDEAVEQACVLSGASLVRIVDVVKNLRVHPGRMIRNLELSGGLIMAEAIMMALAQSMGRQAAHELVHAAAAESAGSGVTFSDVLAKNEVVTGILDPAQVSALLDPRSHVGLSAVIARETSDRARQAASAYRESGSR